MKNSYKILTLTIFLITIISYSNSFSQLSGNYTIGSGGNFTTITSAVTALNTNGVNGPVTFLLEPGIYGEAVNIGAVAGTSPVNTITFRPNGDSGTVTWNSFTSSIDYMIKISGTHYLTFKNIIFQNSMTTSVLDIQPLSGNISIINNFFYSTVDYSTMIKVYGGNVNDLLVKGNYFGADYVTNDRKAGINVLNSNPNLVISNNSFYNFSPCIALTGVDSPLIEGNYVQSFQSHGLTKGIKVDNCSNFKISKNKVTIESGSNSNTISIGIWIVNCNSTASTVVNNFVTAKWFSGSIRLDNSTGIKIYFNTLFTMSYSLFSVEMNDCNALSLKNNIYKGSNFLYTFFNSLISFESDNNNFHRTTTNPIAKINNTYPWIQDLSALVTATQNDSHSTASQVFFVSENDLHLTGSSIGNSQLLGTPIAEVTDDIDGNPRNPLTPYKGADELPNANLSLNLTAFIQGFYDNVSNSQIGDTVRVYLRGLTSPHFIADSSKGFLNAAGIANLSFPGIAPGNYYIVIKHRNSIETWSRVGIKINNDTTINYNFSITASQAYGNNQIRADYTPSRFAIYSGDVNQDGIIDVLDLAMTDNDAYNFVSGYVNTDVNGNNVVDGIDLGIVNNNVSLAVSKITPP